MHIIYNLHLIQIKATFTHFRAGIKLLPDTVNKEIIVEATEKDDEMAMLKEDILTGNCWNRLVKNKQVFDAVLLVAPIIGAEVRYRSKCQICSDYAPILMFRR